jgi:hypothetical protein
MTNGSGYRAASPSSAAKEDRDFTAKSRRLGNLYWDSATEAKQRGKAAGATGREGGKNAPRTTALIPPCQASDEDSDERTKKREEESSRGSDGRG